MCRPISLNCDSFDVMAMKEVIDVNLKQLHLREEGRKLHLGSCHFIAASDRECENLEIRWLLFEGMIFCSNCCQLWNKTGGSATCEVCSALRLKGLDDRSVGRLGLVVAVEEQGSGGCTPRLVKTGQ